jgi:hypothetical protein
MSLGDGTLQGSAGGPTGRPKFSQLPGFRILYALGGALAFGVVCGLLHAPFWAVPIGGLAAAAAAFRLEWDAMGGPEVRQRPNFALLISAAFLFVAMVGVGVVALGYFLDEWAIFKLAHH